MQSDEIDTYLILVDPAGLPVMEDDDGAGNLDSRLAWTVPIDGRYLVVATSYGEDLGAYQIMIRELVVRPIGYAPIRVGEAIAGALEDTDGTRSDERFVDGYRFSGRLGEGVVIDLESAQFDTYLFVLAPTGEVIRENDDVSLESSNSRVALALPYDGEYRVLVTSYEPNSGDYRLALSRLSADPVIDLPLAVGEAVEGELAAGDGSWVPRQTYADGYSFEASRGQRVVLDLTSGSLDSYLLLLGPDGIPIAENDDVGDQLDSRITVRLPGDGLYRAIVTSYSLSEGAYTLSLRTLADTPVEPQSVALGESIDGEIVAADPVGTNDQRPVDVFTLPLEGGQRVILEATSERNDPALRVTSPTGELLIEDDDSGEGRDARLDFTAPHTGTYLVGVTVPPGQIGTYRLTTRLASEGLATAVRLQMGQRVSGDLGVGDTLNPGNGAYQDRYVFEGAAGAQVEIRIASAQIDALLSVTSPSGSPLAVDDDSGGGLDARVQLSLPENGEYTVLATSYSPAVGVYSIVVESLTGTRVTPRPISVGETAEGELSPTDPRSTRYGTAMDLLEFECARGQRVVGTMRSMAVDSYLLLVDPNGETLSEADDGAGGLDAAVGLTCALPGTYQLIPTSAHPGYGPYQIILELEPERSPADPFWVQ